MSQDLFDISKKKKRVSNSGRITLHITSPKPGWGMKRKREIGLFQTSLIDQEHSAKWSQENGINHGVCRKLDGVSDGEEWNYR